jgi:hypothetical protein
VLRDACVGMGIVVLGMSRIKPVGEGVLGTLAGVSSKQPIWDRGWGYTPQCVPTFTVFRSLGVGVLLALGGSPRSKTEWQTFSRDLYLHTIPLSVGLGPSWARQCRTIPASRIAGYQWGRGGGETTLSVRLPCGNTGVFHSSSAIPYEGEIVLRAGCRMVP